MPQEAHMTEQAAIIGATIINGTGSPPVADGIISIADGRITAVGRAQDVPVADGATTFDARGKYAIPGLIDGVNSAWFNVNVETLVRYEGRYHELFLEAAQIALRSGVTGMFATWRSHGPARQAREIVKSGKEPGSRIYVGGNIIGFDGIFSPDAYPDAAAFVSRSFVERVNDEFVKGTGRDLMWMTPDDVRSVIRNYVQTQDLDYVKYAACGHYMQGGYLNAQFLCFSPRQQRAIVEEAHAAGLTVQAHTMSVESADMAVEAGLDILTHGDISGPWTPYPQETIDKIVRRGIGVGVLPVTDGNLEARKRHAPGDFTDFVTVAKTNRRNLIKAGAQMYIGTECSVMSPDDIAAPPVFEDHSVEPSLHWQIGEGHFNALVALEEEGMAPMEILKAVTSNAPHAYKLNDIGTLEPGKIADVVLLDANPLDSAHNYRKIHAVIKDGRKVDRDALPLNPVITGHA